MFDQSNYSFSLVLMSLFMYRSTLDSQFIAIVRWELTEWCWRIKFAGRQDNCNFFYWSDSILIIEQDVNEKCWNRRSYLCFMILKRFHLWWWPVLLNKEPSISWKKNLCFECTSSESPYMIVPSSWTWSLPLMMFILCFLSHFILAYTPLCMPHRVGVDAIDYAFLNGRNSCFIKYEYILPMGYGIYISCTLNCKERIQNFHNHQPFILEISKLSNSMVIVLYEITTKSILYYKLTLYTKIMWYFEII